MASCEMCGGLGRVGPGGITSRFRGLFGSADGLGVRECRRCHGTGRVDEAEPESVPGPRTGVQLSAALPGEWLVEIHGSGRILAVMRFLLAGEQGSHRFDARCEFGGLLGWEATGEWAALGPGDVIRFSGTQSSPYVPTTGYYWGATLRRRDARVLHGESLAQERTMWSRQPDPARPVERPRPVLADGARR